jgi:hypothetical protein
MCKMLILIAFDEREDSIVILIDMPLTSCIIIVGLASWTSLQSHALFDWIWIQHFTQMVSCVETSESEVLHMEGLAI